MRLPFLYLWALVACAAPPPPATDADGDGYPDAAELHSEEDRRAFVDSFVAVALAQVGSTPESTFDPSQRDCAGLVRYAYREALKAHDAAFAARHLGLRRLPEVRTFHYPSVPFLGTRLFRVRPGGFDPAAVERDFAVAPEAVRLAEGSARRIAGVPSAGDLALFRSAAGVAHLMIIAGDGPDAPLVYHTGPHDGGPGEVRRASLLSLRSHPDSAWRPLAANPSFQGFFRFRILGAP